MNEQTLEQHALEAAKIHHKLLVLQTLSLKSKNPALIELRTKTAQAWDDKINSIVELLNA